MVIFIDKSIGEELSRREMSKEETVFFTRLAYLHRDGRGYLCGDPDSLLRLGQKLPGVEKGIYYSIKGHYAESGSVMRSVQKVLVLTFLGDPTMLPDFLQKPGKALCGLLPNALGWDLGQKCCLLGENLEDCVFFQHVAAYYRDKHGLKGLQESFQNDPGGGNTIGNTLKERVQKDRRPILCIADSDRKYGRSTAYPQEPSKGETYKRAKDVSDELTKDQTLPPHKLFHLDVHEVENLIPISLLREFQAGCPQMEAGLDKLEELKNLRNSEPVLYYDLKNGFPYLKPGPKRAYWQEILEELGGEMSNMPPEEEPKEKKNPPKMVFPPVNKRLLERVNVKLREMPISKICLDTYLEPYWEALGEIVFTWGCASMPSSA